MVNGVKMLPRTATRGEGYWRMRDELRGDRLMSETMPGGGAYILERERKSIGRQDAIMVTPSRRLLTGRGIA